MSVHHNSDDVVKRSPDLPSVTQDQLEKSNTSQVVIDNDCEKRFGKILKQPFKLQILMEFS
jgi:hypothetical protein